MMKARQFGGCLINFNPSYRLPTGTVIWEYYNRWANKDLMMKPGN